MSRDRGPRRTLPSDVMYCPFCAAIISRDAMTCDYCLEAIVAPPPRAGGSGTTRGRARTAEAPAAESEGRTRVVMLPEASGSLWIALMGAAFVAASIAVPLAAAADASETTSGLVIGVAVLSFVPIVLGLYAISMASNAKRRISAGSTRGNVVYRGGDRASIGQAIGAAVAVAAGVLIVLYVVAFLNPESTLRERLPLKFPENPASLFEEMTPIRVN